MFLLSILFGEESLLIKTFRLELNLLVKIEFFPCCLTFTIFGDMPGEFLLSNDFDLELYFEPADPVPI